MTGTHPVPAPLAEVLIAPEQTCSVSGMVRTLLLQKWKGHRRQRIGRHAPWIHAPTTGKNVANPAKGQAVQEYGSSAKVATVKTSTLSRVLSC
jgi:hypothetical protein